MAVYNMEQKVKNQLKILGNSHIDDKVKIKIKEYINDLRLEGLTDHRSVSNVF